MTIEQKVADIVHSSGRKQSWLISKMNAINPHLRMTPDKISATLRGKREITAPELMAFCLATDTRPETFFPDPHDAA